MAANHLLNFQYDTMRIGRVSNLRVLCPCLHML